jgi:glycosyltransferase involved in cell wall biosynthesis
MILTSHREGTPLALIQGMASARPFLSTPAGGTVDLMTGTCKPTPKAWWYDNAVLSSANPDAFIEVLSVILANRDRLHSMAVASRSFAQASFDQPRLVGDIATLYQQLLAQQEAVSHPVVEHLL